MPTREKKPPEYRPTLLDRHGAGAMDFYRAGAYGLMAAILSAAAFALGGGGVSFLSLVTCLAFGGATGWGALMLAKLAGDSVKTLATSGAGAPYTEQYSYQQALVMQGRVDDALESFEALIAESPNLIDARLRAAELYARDTGNARRAAELFREVQRMPHVSPREDVYASNRLVDLLLGPLSDSGRAMVELRRLIDLYPGSSAAVQAREGLARLKTGRT